jgi:hypothetical protein
VEAMDVPVENEAEVLKVFLYDSKGTPQKDSFDCVLVDIKDPRRKTRRLRNVSVRITNSDGIL